MEMSKAALVGECDSVNVRRLIAMVGNSDRAVYRVEVDSVV
jgi:hypothetical protein